MIDKHRLEFLNRELNASFSQVSEMLSKCQIALGVMQSLIYIIRKESEEVSQSVVPGLNGDSK